MATLCAAALLASVAGAQYWEVDNHVLRHDAERQEAEFGAALAAGDFDGDGVTDIAVGAPGWPSATTDDAGTVTIYRSFTDRTMANFHAAWIASGSTDSRLGAVLVAGDFDGDGRDELAAGSPRREVGAIADAGSVYLFDYNPSTGAWAVSQFNQNGTSFTPAEQDDHFGQVLAVGNFNGDDWEDLAVGTPDEGWNATAGVGVVQVYYGSSSGLVVDAGQGFVAGQGGLLGVQAAGDAMGSALAVGDFDGDGYDDLAFAAPKRLVATSASAGEVHVLRGSASGLTTTGQQLLRESSFPPAAAEADDRFGFALAAANFDEIYSDCVFYTCYDDLAIGVPFQDLEGAPNAGKVLVAYGGEDGLQTAGATTLTAFSGGGVHQLDQYFGYGLAAGTADQPSHLLLGIGDLLVGAPLEDFQVTDSGRAYLMLGATSGLNGGPVPQRVAILPGMEAAPPEEYDIAGMVMLMGDFDDDGYGDVALGLPYRSSGLLDYAGVVQVLYGAVFANGFEGGGTGVWSAAQP